MAVNGLFAMALAQVSRVGAFWFMCRKAPLHPRAKMAVSGLFAMALAQVRCVRLCKLR